jgi:hypothetical protein
VNADDLLPNEPVDAGYTPEELASEEDPFENEPEPDPSNIDEVIVDYQAAADDVQISSSPGYNALLRAIEQYNAGARENPPGSNCQGYSRYFGAGCVAWCGFFISWCFDTSASGNRDRRVPWSSPGLTRSIYDWGRTNGALVSTPRSGDIHIHGDMSHSGIVRGANSATGAFTSIDGNWSDRVSYITNRNARGDRYSSRYFFVRVLRSPV